MKPWRSVLGAVIFMVLPVMGNATDPGLDAPILLEVEVQSIAGELGEVTLFKLDDLKAFPVVSFETETIWTEGVQHFTGVSLASVVRYFDVTSGTMVLQAVNDYVVAIPVSDAVEGGPIIAYALNGAAMTRRNKGPLWVVFPYDSHPNYQTEEVFSQSIWQMVRITITPGL